VSLVGSGSRLIGNAGGLFAAAAGGAIVNRVGMNATPLQVYGTEMPFMNVLKFARGGGSSLNSWNTSGADHPANLQLDSLGYLTSLTGIDSTVYTSVHGAVFVNINTVSGGASIPPPGATTLYPAGQWRMRITGQFVMTLSGDPTSVACTSPNCSVVGNQVTNTGNGQAVITFNCNTPSTAGITWTFTSVGASPNNPRAMDLVYSGNTTAYDAGEIFDPNFIACMQAAKISIFRDMDWRNQNWRLPQVQFSSTPQINDTSATINGQYSDGTISGNVWLLPTGTYSALWSDGVFRNINCTAYSSTVTFSALSATQTNASVYAIIAPWSNRARPTSALWNGPDGVPIEVIIALGNKLGIDIHHNFNFEGTQSTEYTDVANMFYNGTGCLDGVGTAGLNSAQKLYGEISNEVWNATFPQQKYANYLSQGIYSTANSQKALGYASGTAADAIYAVYGSSAYSSRVVFGVGCQTVSSAYSQLNDSLNTLITGTAAYLHLHGSFCVWVAPYLDITALTNSTDINFILALGDPNLAIMQLAYTNVVSGHTCTQINASGYIGLQISQIQGIQSGISGQPWNTVQFNCYEGGDNFKDGTGGSVAGWKAQLYSCYRDSRFKYVYSDSGKVIDGTHQGFLYMLKAISVGWCTIFSDIDILGNGGYSYGVFESAMQAAQLPTLPPKAQGLANFAQGL